MPLQLSSRLNGILTGCNSIDLYTVGKARKHNNTIAPNSIINANRHRTHHRTRKRNHIATSYGTDLVMILKGFIETDLYTEVGKARNYFNTIASNSIRNTDKRGAPPVRHRVHSAILKPESLDLGADRMTKEWRLSLANRIPRYLMIT